MIMLEVDLAVVKDLGVDAVVATEKAGEKVEEVTPLGLKTPRTRRSSGGKLPSDISSTHQQKKLNVRLNWLKV